MKKNLLLAIVVLPMLAYGQVGINTSTPEATLDITAKNATGGSANVDGLLIPRVDRQRAQSMTGVQTSTMIYINSITSGTQTLSAVNIDAVGYYYFSGGVWVKLITPSAPSVNIYNSDGTLTGNRLVTQGANTLAFTGTATNAFSVSGSTLSVDAANNRVGIGTTTPENKFHVVSTSTSTGRHSLIDAAVGAAEIPILALRNTAAPAVNNLAYLGFSSSNAGGGANWGIGTQQNSAAANDNNFQIAYSSGAPFQKYFNISTNGNTGIGTTTPQNKLHVNGGLQITSELNVGGNATTAGSAGTTGQVLTSAGTGAAPTWQALPAAPASINIYNANGTLTGNRVVTQGANTLAFTGTAANAFSVDGTSLSVDAANHRVGIGTTTPENRFHVVSTSTVTGRHSLIDAAVGTAEVPILVLRNTAASAANNLAYLGFSSSNAGGGANWGIGTQQNSSGANDNNFQIAYSSGAAFQKYFNILPNGNTGIGNTAPANKLQVTATSDPLRLDGVVNGNVGTDELMAINASGVVKKLGTVEALGIPRPAVFKLDTTQNNFLSAQVAGEAQVIPMSLVTNGVSGLTYNTATNTITMPAGIYQVVMVYEASHNSVGCTISSYYVDFPTSTGVQRVHSTASHVQGSTSNHGGTINYVTTVQAGKTYQIHLGRGVSGNCLGAGMTLVGTSTQVLIYKIGN